MMYKLKYYGIIYYKLNIKYDRNREKIYFKRKRKGADP